MCGVHRAVRKDFFRWAMTFRQDSGSKIKPEAAFQAKLFTLTCAPRMSEARGVVNGGIVQGGRFYVRPRASDESTKNCAAPSGPWSRQTRLGRHLFTLLNQPNNPGDPTF